LRKLQRNLELYIEQSSFNHFETRIPGKVDDSGFQVRSITAVQAKAMEADYLAASGRPEEAHALSPSVALDEVAPTESIPFVPSSDQAQADNKPRSETQDDTPCPLSQILKGASERATEMVDNLQRFVATEEIEHTEFKRNGSPRKATNQLFSYVAEID